MGIREEGMRFYEMCLSYSEGIFEGFGGAYEEFHAKDAKVAQRTQFREISSATSALPPRPPREPNVLIFQDNIIKRH